MPMTRTSRARIFPLTLTKELEEEEKRLEKEKRKEVEHQVKYQKPENLDSQQDYPDLLGQDQRGKVFIKSNWDDDFKPSKQQ